MEESRFAGSVAAEEPDDFAGFDREVDTIEYGNSGFEGSVDIGECEDVHLSPPFRGF
jgi:hypothetical protein